MDIEQFGNVWIFTQLTSNDLLYCTKKCMFSGTISAFAGECGPDVLDAAPSVQALLGAVLRRVAHGHVQLAVDSCGEKISMAANYAFMVTTLMSTKNRSKLW